MNIIVVTSAIRSPVSLRGMAGARRPRCCLSPGRASRLGRRRVQPLLAARYQRRTPFLMKRHELLSIRGNRFTSNLVKVNMDGDLDDERLMRRPTSFTLCTAACLRRGPDVNCAVHVHTRTGMAIAGLKGGLRMISPGGGVRFSISDTAIIPIEGITEDSAERERLIARSRRQSRHDHAQSRRAHRGQDRAEASS